MPPATTVRFATPADAATIVEFVRGLAVFEREPPERVRLTEADVRRDGFGAGRVFETLIVERDGRAVGFALFFPHYSTWEGSAGLYVEDLFVTEEARGTGAGRALLAALARVARDRG
ncbi:MAG: GNAT family N-acetyltransferase, partial [Dehalococcoidia bacterium]